MTRRTDSGANADRTYEAIRTQILSGRRLGGEWLREEDLAKELGVSRTPVREALRRLAADGLVRHERHRGVQVQSWSVDDVEEIFEIRGMLEAYGARRAATSDSLDIAELSALAEAMQRAAEEHDLDAVTALNNRFHAAIVDAAGRARLGPLLASLVHVPLVHNTFAHYTAESLQRSLDQHCEVVAALRAGDPDWAESAMRAHIRHGWVSIRDRLPAAPTSDA
ncbi:MULTISPECIES: GntR family transcriptional regulator [Mumia]|uniref:GntR family transcriptional regulator n=1 Tax=Mumia TaxID=1546255 RepID=UPI00141FB815|nr:MULTISPECIES: GntR family transcriptional regulator [unclassified Mumia]QMW66959.1 GntR family transcriptional regulator [Mumia sp. ZJ1417]